MARVFGVAIRKGGQGKSTTVSTLARLCAIQGARVLIIDLAQPGTTTTSFRDLWPEAAHDDFSQSLLDLRTVPAGAEPDKPSSKSVLASHHLPVHLMSKPSWGSGSVSILPHDDLLGEAAAYLESDRVLAGLVDALSDSVDIVIIDYPNDGGPLIANALAATNRLIIPLVPEVPSLEGVDATLRLMARARQAGHDIRLGGVLLTKCDPRNKRAADIVRTLTHSGEVEGESLSRRLLPFAVRSSEYFEQAFRYGVPVWERTEDSQHWAGYALLAMWALREANLERLTVTPRLEARLDPNTRILYSPGLALGKPEVAYSEFQQAHTSLSA